MTAAALPATVARAHLADVGPVHNEQVALTNLTGKQLSTKSHINGTAPVASEDGQFVVFSTDAALVRRDTNGLDDVYLRAVAESVTVLVSSKKGVPGNDYSFEPTISADGRYVTFTTWSTNLAKDTNGSTLDVLVKDMHTGGLHRVSVNSREQQRKQNSFSPVISGNGRYVSFQTFGSYGPKDKDTKEGVYVRDLRNRTTKQASLLPDGRDVPGFLPTGTSATTGPRSSSATTGLCGSGT